MTRPVFLLSPAVWRGGPGPGPVGSRPASVLRFVRGVLPSPVVPTALRPVSGPKL